MNGIMLANPLKAKPSEQNSRLTGRIRKPAALLALILAAGAALNALAAGWVLYPAVKKHSDLQMRYSEARLALAAAENAPNVRPVDPAEREALLRRVPTNPEIVSFVFALREIGNRSGAEIVGLNYMGRDAAGSETPSSAGTGTGANAEGGASAAEEFRYELLIRGSYGQIAAFFLDVLNMERLVSIPVWRFVQELPQGAEEEQRILMTMELVLYAGVGYDGKFDGFSGPPQPEAPSGPADRFDPTMGDREFLEMLGRALSEESR